MLSGGSTSNWTEVPSGVPQGSVLGPILFAALIDDLQPVSQNVTYIKYADDVSVVITMRDASNDSSTAELSHIVKWSEEHSLELNMKKCQTLDFSTKRSLVLQPVTAPGGTVFESVSSARVLGVIFSTDMKWTTHVDHVCKVARKRMGLLRILKRNRCPTTWCWTVYYAMIRSILTYACPAWCNASKAAISCLVSLERKAEQLLGGRPSTPINDFMTDQCTRLARSVRESPTHPISCVFDWTERRHSMRLSSSSSSTSPHYARTSRFQSSFTKFA